MIMCFFVFVSFLSKVNALINGYELLGKIIFLDAGHGGVDAGSSYNDILEKDINLQIVKKLKRELISRGATVYLTRDSDKDLSVTKVGRKKNDLTNRAILINKSKADMYLSIHQNFIIGDKWRGIQIFYNDRVKENEVIAKTLTNALKEHSKLVRDEKKNNEYYMYKQINVPGVLIETGFLSNPDDRYLLQSEEYQEKLVKYIADGIVCYFS